MLALLVDPATRLITLTGPGGVGKTRLAIAAATSARHHFADGVVVVALATMSSPDRVVPAIADALGWQEMAGRDRLDQVRVSLRARHLLLVLDNFEHVVAAAPAVARLAVEAPALTILVTSRPPPCGRGARVARLPYGPGTYVCFPRGIGGVGGGQLFVARAREHDLAFPRTRNQPRMSRRSVCSSMGYPWRSS